MSVRGMKETDWVAVTLCDFNDPSRRESIRTHYSIDAAVRAFKNLNKIYGDMGRCWQETREGEVINDNRAEKT